MTAALPNANVTGYTQEYTTLIAHDILIRALSAVVERAEQNSSNLQNGMAEAERIREYRDELNQVMIGLAKLRKDNEYTAEQLVSLHERMREYERALLPVLGSDLVAAANWR